MAFNSIVKNIIAATLVKSGAGRVGYVSITNNGPDGGFLYDSTSLTPTVTERIAHFPGGTNAGNPIVLIDLPFATGLVAVPGGAGTSNPQQLAVSYD